MNRELLSAIINSGVQITLRGSVAYCIHRNEEYSRTNDVDIIFSSPSDLDEFTLRLRLRKINIAPVEYLTADKNIPRKRFCISSNSSDSLIIDALIYDKYFPDATPISTDSSTTFLPTSEELLAENLLSISSTAVGMKLSNWNAKGKGKRILRRVCRLYRVADSRKAIRCLTRLLEIQNSFYATKVTIEEVLAGAHRYSKRLGRLFLREPNSDFDIYALVLEFYRIIEGLYETERTEFYNSNDRYGCFSNFSAHRVVFDQINWPTAEHCYQAQKFTNRVLWANILDQSTAKEAARLGRENSSQLRIDWDSIKVSKMYEIVKAKIIQNPDIYLTLISTGNSAIVETSPTDPFWGIGSNGKGKNHLGKIIESIREDIR